MKCVKSGKRFLGRVLQRILDTFYIFGRAAITLIVYLSLRTCAFEVSLKDVWQGKYASNVPKYLDLDQAKHLDTLLDVAKECHIAALARRALLTDKCKTLLTVCSLLLVIAGLFLPRAFSFSTLWMRAAFFLAALSLFDAVVLLLVFLGVRTNTEIDLGQEIVSLNREDLQKSLVNSHRICQLRIDEQTDHLADLYKAARFYFIVWLTTVVVLFSFSYLRPSHENQVPKSPFEQRGGSSLGEQVRVPKAQSLAPTSKMR
ncbi:MAG: hypothetical protein WC655_12685 [Candidatus Hydrogenedentales bacterium]|jgi:hypothetical protein